MEKAYILSVKNFPEISDATREIVESKSSYHPVLLIPFSVIKKNAKEDKNSVATIHWKKAAANVWDEYKVKHPNSHPSAFRWKIDTHTKDVLGKVNAHELKTAIIQYILEKFAEQQEKQSHTDNKE